VITSGTYRFIHHPGYTAAVGMFIAIPLALASWGALWPAAVAIELLVVRTELEYGLLGPSCPAMPTMHAERVIGSCRLFGDGRY
jgi:isoprenylcysteine carboxyl methyltransferase (ICMT) family protein YpbQ